MPELLSTSASPEGLLEFLDASPTPYHLVQAASDRLTRAGFTEVREEELWANRSILKAGGKYWLHRNRTTLLAFTVGGQYVPGGEFKMIGAHTDSPVLKVKPVSGRSANGYLQVGVQTYGGGLWHTWFDRDLTLAGAVVRSVEGGVRKELVHVKRPVLRIPTLCIHLQSADERASFQPNKENHLVPILGQVADGLNQATDRCSGHSPSVINLLKEELGGDAGSDSVDIKDLDLTLCDTQPGAIWGANKEFLSSPRLDNQVHCYTSLVSLLDHCQDLADDTGVNMIALFDHEEIGSDSAQGAGSPIMAETMSRIVRCFSPDPEVMNVTLRKSLLISADVAHAVHPNYSDKHEKLHQPHLNKGTVIKTNENQRYATNLETGFLLREVARLSEAKVQEFVVRNDTPCGSTIGPILASGMGVRTVDVGVPSLSMHSIRETMGVEDVADNARLFRGFFRMFGNLQQTCQF